MTPMTAAQKQRYSRQIMLAGLGAEGQEALLDARVAIVGLGALGSFQAAALARAGIGHLALIDRDYVELVNLQRQWLYEEADAQEALPKAIAAARHLARVNSEVRLTAHVADLTADNIAELLEGAELILDGTDNFETRYLINDYAVRQGLPWVYGAALGTYGLSMPVLPGRTACLKCLYPSPPQGAPPTCETEGILNAVTSAVASLQAAAALKILAGQAAALEPRITTLDLWTGEIRQIRQPGPQPGCRACGERRFEHLESSARAPITLCGRNAVQIHQRAGPVDLAELKRRLAPLGEVRANEFALRFSTPPYQITIFPDGRAIIQGTTDPGVARGLYARYVGG